MKNKIRKRLLLLVYLIPILIAVLLKTSGNLDGQENTVSDKLYQKGTIVSPNIYVIGIDEETLNTYGAFDTWSRDKMADMINLLMADPDNAPKVIAVDVGYYGKKDQATDDKLVKAVANAGNVVFVSSATFGTEVDEDGEGNYTESTQTLLLEEPFDELKDAALAVGYSNNAADKDGIVRHAKGDIYYQGQYYPSFAAQIRSAYLYGIGRTDRSTKDSFYIRYAGKPHAYFGAVGSGSSFKRVLEGEYPTQAFKDSIVLIGAYASGTQDQYFSAIDHATPMYGVEIHANILQQELEGVYYTELPDWVELVMMIGIGLLIIILLNAVDIKISATISVLLAAGYVYGITVLFDKAHLVLPVIFIPMEIVLLIITHILVRYFTVFREKKKIIASYGKYLSPEVAATIAESGEAKLQLGGQKKDIAVLFVDIRGFTTLSEKLGPEEVVKMLNSYLKVTTSAIFHNQGTVDKFIGDATMGVFNAPLDLEDYTYKAVLAGLEMAENSKNMVDELDDELKGKVGFGVGINAGEAVVGNIGTDFRMEYTAIGDTVNTASRLEGQAKAGNVVISEEVYKRVKDRIECEDLGFVSLKGKAEQAHIYRAVKKITE